MTRKGTIALDGSRNGSELIDSSALAASFDNLAQYGNGMLEMVLFQLFHAHIARNGLRHGARNATYLP